MSNKINNSEEENSEMIGNVENENVEIKEEPTNVEIPEMSEEEIEKKQEEDRKANQAINDLNDELKMLNEEGKKLVKPRKKKDTETDSSEDLIQDLASEFSSFLEKTVKISPEKEARDIIPVGIKVLDAMLGGGITVGTFNMIIGQPGSGKSMLAAQFLASCQRKFKDSLCGYLDSEETMSKIRLFNLGVKNPPQDPYTDVTVEKVFKFIEGLSVFKQEKKISNPSLVVWDSIANTLSERERNAEDVNSVIGYKARLLSILLPKYISKMGNSNISVLAVNQWREQLQLGNYAQPKQLKFMTAGKSIPGGDSLVHNTFTLLEMKVKEVITDEKYGFNGVISNIVSVKNKLFVPNIEAKLVADFNYGFSDFWTSYQFLVDNKKLTTGAWNYLVAKPDVKFRTKDAFDKYNEMDEFKKAFDDETDEAIRIHITEKYGIKAEI